MEELPRQMNRRRPGHPRTYEAARFDRIPVDVFIRNLKGRHVMVDYQVMVLVWILKPTDSRMLRTIIGDLAQGFNPYYQAAGQDIIFRIYLVTRPEDRQELFEVNRRQIEGMPFLQIRWIDLDGFRGLPSDGMVEELMALWQAMKEQRSHEVAWEDYPRDVMAQVKKPWEGRQDRDDGTGAAGQARFYGS
ncbi:unnamed protein product [Bursaphelenchus okinawaensis]|uniref:Uncharacterized protein n=1 Tax=Bursaphelenchus okinawaensis TaxID=465554 RepID=A0A811JSD5_9BILA|nr:unnamed protein product [Bursaphelenchus okinawaensis]CAG9080345.1 unnamed protein product [Bursaphelenchus okinawaensis]